MKNSKKQLEAIATLHNVNNGLLSPGSTNTKTAKNKVKTFILYLAPHRQNSRGKNLCSNASAGCIQACLFTAGHGKFDNTKQARINKTNFLVHNIAAFIQLLAIEIETKIKTAVRKGEHIQFRLNGTSDLGFLFLLNKYANFDYKKTPKNVRFYDYTPNLKRAVQYKNDPKYTLTFSRKEDNWQLCKIALSEGVNVAAVFNVKKDQPLPTMYQGFKVIDGDSSDDIMTEHKGVILGLRAKGEAKKDVSGFVIQSPLQDSEELTGKELFNSLLPGNMVFNNKELINQFNNLKNS